MIHFGDQTHYIIGETAKYHNQGEKGRTLNDMMADLMELKRRTFQLWLRAHLKQGVTCVIPAYYTEHNGIIIYGDIPA